MDITPRPALWAASVADVAPVFAPGATDAQRGGSLEVWFAGGLALARQRAAVLDWTRAPSAVRSAPFDGVFLQVFGGAGRLDVPGTDGAALAPGDVVAFDMNRPFRFRVRAASGAVHIGLWIPTERLSDMPVGANLQGLHLAAASPGGALLAAAARALADRVGAMNETDFRELTAGVADLASRILRQEVRHAQRRGSAMELDTFLTVRRFVDRNLASPKLSPQLVAKNFGLSRAAAYRLFEPVGGVGRYIRNRRLQRAYEEITAPALADRRIGEIAYALGFQSFSAFSRLFSRTYGKTPLGARKAALSITMADPDKSRGIPSGDNLFAVLSCLK